MGLETFFTPSEQAVFFLYSVLLGAGLGVVFDCFRAARILVPHTAFLVAVEDILFAFLWAVALMVFSVEVCRGETRFYYMVGNVLGFVVYMLTVGKVVVKVFHAIAKAVYAILHFFWRIFIRPVQKVVVSICQIIQAVFVRNHSKLKDFIKRTKLHLKDRQKMLYNRHKNNKKQNIRKGEVKRIEKIRHKKTKTRRSAGRHGAKNLSSS